MEVECSTQRLDAISEAPQSPARDQPGASPAVIGDHDPDDAVGLAPLDTVECGVAAATPLPSAGRIDSPIVGTWKVDFTKEELAASPYLYDLGEINDENWGELTLIFSADGNVTNAQVNPIASSSTSGTYAIDGDTVVLVFDEGGNRGETFGGRWSIFRDTLTFRRTDTAILPTPYLVRAWTLVR